MNVKEELILTIEQARKTPEDVIAIKVSSEDINIKSSELTDYELSSLDYEYDNGYGAQELFGVVLFNDNTWLSRWEYDGSEGWEYNEIPTVEEILMNF